MALFMGHWMALAYKIPLPAQHLFGQGKNLGFLKKQSKQQPLGSLQHYFHRCQNCTRQRKSDLNHRKIYQFIVYHSCTPGIWAAANLFGVLWP